MPFDVIMIFLASYHEFLLPFPPRFYNVKKAPRFYGTGLNRFNLLPLNLTKLGSMRLSLRRV